MRQGDTGCRTQGDTYSMTQSDRMALGDIDGMTRVDRNNEDVKGIDITTTCIPTCTTGTVTALFCANDSIIHGDTESMTQNA